MRWIKTYENYSDLLVQCEDILVDLIQDGVSVDVIKRNKTTYSEKEADIIRIIFNDKGRESFNPLKYIDSFDHLNSFLESNGYRYFSDGSYYETYGQRRESFQEGGRLLLLAIDYIKE